MKKHLISLFICLLTVCYGFHTANAQCAVGFAYSSTTLPTIVNSTASIGGQYAGEYSTFNSAVAGSQYRFNSSNTTDYITIRSGTSAGPVVAFGTQPVTYTAATSGALIVSIHTSSLCGTQSVGRSLSATLLSTSGYCLTNLYSSGCSFGDNINSLLVSNLNQNGTGCTGGTTFANYTGTTVNFAQGTTYNYTLNCSYTSSEYVGWWIDFNNNNSFGDAGEFVLVTQVGNGGNITGTIAIPSGAALGNHRMRVRVVYSTPQSLSTSCTAYTYGEAHDYTANIIGYCTTGLYSTGCSSGDNINNISVSNLSQTATGCTGGTGIANYTATTVNFSPNTTYPYTITCTYTSSEYVGWWIDFNDNMSFGDVGEFVLATQVGNGGTITGTIAIPSGAAVGNHRMRVRVVYLTPQSLSTSCTAYTYGEAHDYTANIASCSPVSIAPTTISGTTSICSGQSTTLTASGGTLASGGSVQWYTGSCGGTLVFTGNPITVSPTSNTTYYVRYNSSCGATSCINTTVTVAPVPTATSISPSSPVICSGGNVVLSSTMNYSGAGNVTGFASLYAPGNWTTINPALGSINSSGAPSTLSITSGNSSIVGGTEYRITVPASGTITFSWSYSTVDGAPYDYPQYTTDGTTYTVLPGYSTGGSTVQSGTASIAVTQGSVFGIRMYTVDGGFGAATTTFTNFTAPAQATYTYMWAPSSSLTGTTTATVSGSQSSSVTASPSSTQAYSLTVAAGSCSVTRNVTVTVLSGTIISYNVTGGGNVCAGNGIDVGLSGSSAGDSYQLMRNGNPIGSPVIGDGNPINFGSQTVAGTYTVGATSGGCTAIMNGSAVVNVISIIPTAAAISPANPTICETNSITLSSALAYSATETGTTNGFSGAYAPGNWSITNPVGGSISTSGAPSSITMVSGNSSISGGTDYTIPVAGTATISFSWSYTTVDGASYDYPMYTTNGSTYSILPGYSTLGSTVQSGTFSTTVAPGAIFGIRMYTADGVFGSATVVFSNFQVVGTVPASFTYQWSPTESLSGAVSGTVTTGSLNSSVVATPPSTQIYTVTATANGCSASATTTVTVAGNLAIYNVTGGGTSCNSGFPVGLSGSSIGVAYQLLRNGSPVGSPLNGTGDALDFGTQNLSGSYTVSGNGAGCIVDMNGSAEIIIASPPTANAVTPSSPTICAGNSVNLSSLLTIPPISTNVVSGFSGSYSPANWSIVNNVGGSVTTGSAPASISIVSGNSSIVGGVDFTINVPVNGTVSFSWSYSTIDGAPYDYPMYTTDGSFYTILPGYSTSGSANQTGTFSMSVTGGSTFGLRMYTVDGIFGAATTVFSNFSAPGAVYPSFTYAWSPNSSLSGASSGSVSNGSINSTVNASPTSTQSYTVVATGPGGCSSSASVTVNVIAPPISYNVSGGGIYCAGSGLSVNLSGSQSGINYQLMRNSVAYGSPVSGTGSGISFNNLTLAGSYNINAIGPYCTVAMNGSASISISSPPSAVASAGASAVCPGNLVNLIGSTDASGATFSWSSSPSTNIANASASSTTANPTVPTTFTLTVFANGCTTVSAPVEVGILTGPPISVSSSLSSVCYGSSVNLSSAEAGGIWSSSPAGFSSTDQNTSATLLVPTSFTYTKVQPDNCISTGTTSTIGILALPVPLPTNNGPKCEGTAIGLFSNVTASSYSWTGPAFSSPYNYSGANVQNPPISSVQAVAGIAGTYTVTVTASNGCTSSATTNLVVHQLPVAQPSIPASPACAGSSVTLVGNAITTGAPIAATGWIWTGPGYTSTTTIQSPVIGSVATTNQGTFTLRVRDTVSAIRTALLV
jgi:hypothetical protein